MFALTMGLIQAGETGGGVKGAFSRKLDDDAVWTIHLDGKGKFKVERDGELGLEGTYKVTKDQMEITDEKGKFLSPDAADKTGTYKWKLEGDKLTFTKVKDSNKGRSEALLSGPWERKKK
ncbi:MAG: hypothetical protein U0793_14790 [Gemmataceae bacterium]